MHSQPAIHAALVSVLLIGDLALAQGGLKCVQRPTLWIVGQQNRIVIETLGDCGRLEVFWAQIATAAARAYKRIGTPELYEMAPEQLMERTIALIDVSPESSYAVSIFRLRGGLAHLWSFHGPRGSAKCAGLSLIPQGRGTLAGPDVDCGERKVAWNELRDPHRNCFPFLYDVHRAKSDSTWRVDWTLEKYPDIHLRMHSVYPTGADVALAKGKPLGGGKPYELQWVVQQIPGRKDSTLSTQFATVLDAYEVDPVITKIRRVDVTAEARGDQPPVAFEVTCGDRVDTIVHCHGPGGAVKTSNGVEMRGTFGVWSEVDGKVVGMCLANGTRMGKGRTEVTIPQPSWTGRIVRAGFAERRIVVAPAPKHGTLLAGSYCRITNEQGNDVTHRILATKPRAEGVEMALALDPRIGEGQVADFREDGIISGTKLLFGGGALPYYMGKTLSNEDASAVYRLHGVHGRRRAYIHRGCHQGVNEAQLRQQFADRDGDGIPRFLIYDYGPGDTVTVPYCVSLRWTSTRRSVCVVRTNAQGHELTVAEAGRQAPARSRASPRGGPRRGKPRGPNQSQRSAAAQGTRARQTRTHLGPARRPRARGRSRSSTSRWQGDRRA